MDNIFEDITPSDEEALTRYLGGQESFVDEEYNPYQFLFHWQMRILSDPVFVGSNDTITTGHREAM